MDFWRNFENRKSKTAIFSKLYTWFENRFCFFDYNSKTDKDFEKFQKRQIWCSDTFKSRKNEKFLSKNKNLAADFWIRVSAIFRDFQANWFLKKRQIQIICTGLIHNISKNHQNRRQKSCSGVRGLTLPNLFKNQLRIIPSEKGFWLFFIGHMFTSLNYINLLIVVYCFAEVTFFWQWFN